MIKRLNQKPSTFKKKISHTQKKHHQKQNKKKHIEKERFQSFYYIKRDLPFSYPIKIGTSWNAHNTQSQSKENIPSQLIKMTSITFLYFQPRFLVKPTQ